MADVDQNIQITLTARDEASAAIEKVTQALQKLGALNLSSIGEQLRSVGSTVEALETGLRAAGTAAEGLGTAFERAGTAADALGVSLRTATDGARAMASALGDAGAAASSVGERAKGAAGVVGQAMGEQTASVEDNLRRQQQAVDDHYRAVEDSLRQSLQRQNALVAASTTLRSSLAGAGMGAAGAALVPYGGRGVEPYEALPYATITEITPPRLDLAPLQDSVQLMQRLTDQYSTALARLQGPSAAALPAGVANDLVGRLRAVDALEENLQRAGYAGIDEFDAKLRQSGMSAMFEASQRMGSGLFGGGAGGAGGAGGGGMGGGAGAAGAAGAGGVNPFEAMVEIVRSAMAAMVEATRTAMSEMSTAVRSGFSQAEQAVRSAAPAIAGRARGGEEGGALGRVVGERGLLGERGPVGGGMEIPGLEFAQQIALWGGVYSGIMQATGAVKNFAAGLITTNTSYEELQQTLANIYGSQGAGQRALDWLDKYAEQTPATRDEIRQSGIAFAAVGDDITKVVPATERISAAMHNVGGVTAGTTAIIDAQFGRTEMLRSNLHLTTAELERYGMVVEKSGHIAEGTFIPAVERMTGTLNDQYMKTHNLTADPKFANSVQIAMQALGALASNVGDVFEDLQRRAGAGMFGALEKGLTPIINAIGDQGGVGGVLTHFADQIGQNLGRAMTSGLDAISKLYDKLGGLPGIIIIVQRAWIEFTSALHTAWSVVEGVGDALGNVWQFVSDLGQAIGTILSPIKAFFDVFNAGHDSLRQMTSLIVTLGVELKILATVYDLVKGTAERFGGILGGEDSQLAANTAAIEANTAALQGNAAASGASGAGRGLGVPAVPGGTGPALPAALVSDATVAGKGFLGTLGEMSMAFYAAVGPMAAFLADLYLVPAAFSAASTAIQNLRGRATEAQGAQPDINLTIPAQYQSTIGPPGVAALQTKGPGAFAAYLQNTFGTEAYQDWYNYVQTGRPEDFISYLQRNPQSAARIAAEYGAQGGQGGAGYITALTLGTAPNLTGAEAANPYTMFNQAVAQTQRDAASSLLRTSLPGDVATDIQAYGAVYRAQHPGATDQQVGAAVDRYGIPLYRRYGLPAPEQLPQPTGATGPSPQDLAQAAQMAQQQVGWDEALRVPYAQFKKDMDAATKAMTAAGDPADEVRAFYKQNMDQWAHSTAQLAQNQVSADLALKKPYDQVAADFDNLATALAAEGDSNDEIVAKLDQAIQQYFNGLIQASQRQLSALETIGAPVSQQLGEVSHQQALMDQANQAALTQARKRHLPYVPIYTPEEIAAAGIAGQRQVQAPGLQSAFALATGRYDLALSQGQITSLGQLPGYVGAITAAERAQLANQGVPAPQAALQIQTDQMRLMRQGQDALLQQAKDQLTFDTNAHASAQKIRQDQTAELKIIAAETPGGTHSMTYRLAQQQMTQQSSQSAFDQANQTLQDMITLHYSTKAEMQQVGVVLRDYTAATGFKPGSIEWRAERQRLLDEVQGTVQRPPEPHYGVYGSLTATGAGYGAATVSYGTQLAHDPIQHVIAALREQLNLWRSRALHDELMLAAVNKTATNTGETTSAIKGLHLPPFPSSATNAGASVRASGAPTLVRRV